jgi:glutamyl/glutaminyl-tRNA synthetase
MLRDLQWLGLDWDEGQFFLLETRHGLGLDRIFSFKHMRRWIFIADA